MARIALHFPKLYKAALYTLIAGSFGSGAGWFILHRWFQVEGDFGPEKHPLEPWLLRLHGGLAFAMMIAFGFLLASHVHVAWRSRRNRIFGIAMVSVIAAQILTGYGLYYAGETLRVTVGWCHLASGLALPFLLGLHVGMGHRSRRNP